MRLEVAAQVLGSIVGVLIIYYALWFLQNRPAIPPNAPKRRRDDWPIVGAVKFYRARWDFFKDDISSPTQGTMSFHIGKHVVVAATGSAVRTTFLNDRRLRLGEAYAVLFGHSPGVEPHMDDDAAANSEEVVEDTSVASMGEFNAWFNNRMASALRTENFNRNMLMMMTDVRHSIDVISTARDQRTDPFISAYEMVFQLTFRMLGCEEVAQDHKLRAKVLSLYESLERNSGLSMVLLPWWMPSPKMLARFWSGARLYMTIQSIVEQRRKSNSAIHKDTLQSLIDHGDSTDKIIRFIISVVYSGQVNTGLNAAYVLCFLASHTDSMHRARREVSKVADKYDRDASKSLWQKLQSIPLGAWETEFPFLELCLRESIRLTLHGTAFRWNGSKHDVPLGGSSGNVLPSGAFMAYHMHDVHRNPKIYEKPEAFDPERFEDGRSEDKKVPYGFLGWGAARHPCPGQRFAKFEVTLIVASFLARFHGLSLFDGQGNRLRTVPLASLNSVVTSPPRKRTFLHFTTAN